MKKEDTSCYHAAGTCRTSTEGDEDAVPDAELRVSGVKGLRIADYSALLCLHGGHAQMPAYAIGEKAADLIKEAHGVKVCEPAIVVDPDYEFHWSSHAQCL